MSYPPPQSGYPPGQPAGGYPPGQPVGGYPPPGQPAGGYPPPGQPAGGYPPPGQPAGGYPPPGQPAGGYPPPGQPAGGHPPPGQPIGGYAPSQGQSYGGPPNDDDGPPSDDEPTAEAASAPEEVENFMPQDMSDLKVYDGYGNVGFQAGEFLPPPPPPTYDETQAVSTMEFGKAADITAEEARAALLEFVAENCCYGKGAAEDMKMTNISPSNALHYTLETFCEGRSTARKEVPYHGDMVDGPYNGPPPMPWDIVCAPAQQFVDAIYHMPVPHTEEVRTCGLCMGFCFVRCRNCRGRGRNRCSSCHGRGHRTVHRQGERQSVTCTWCHGSGKRRCNRCHGYGRVTCPHCQGQGRVKNFIELTVTYKNHVTDYIFEETAMPDELVRGVEGVEIFSQVQPQVYPITAFPVKQINDNSAVLVAAARHAHPIERQLNQRQILRAVPVTEVDYTYKDKTSKFWVYGMQRKVHSPDYPQQCCWGCNIL